MKRQDSYCGTRIACVELIIYSVTWRYRARLIYRYFVLVHRIGKISGSSSGSRANNARDALIFDKQTRDKSSAERAPRSRIWRGRIRISQNVFPFLLSLLLSAFRIEISLRSKAASDFSSSQANNSNRGSCAKPRPTWTAKRGSKPKRRT